MLECEYRDTLAAQVDGEIEVILPFGRADVLSATHIFEVEPMRTWRHGVTQALQYASQVPQDGALALYGDPQNLPAVFKEVQRLTDPRLELWWFTGEEFEKVETEADLRRVVQLGDRTPLLPEPAPHRLRRSPFEAAAISGRLTRGPVTVSMSCYLPDQTFAAKLGVESGTEVQRDNQVVFLNGTPIQLQRTWYRPGWEPGQRQEPIRAGRWEALSARPAWPHDFPEVEYPHRRYWTAVEILTECWETVDGMTFRIIESISPVGTTRFTCTMAERDGILTPVREQVGA